jgi:putative endonuclease
MSDGPATPRPADRPTRRPADALPPVPDRRAVGERGEVLAARHLAEQAGLEVIARNWRVADGDLRGELDIVALDHDRGEVVVCEVKTRTGGGFGGPLAAVTRRKQMRIRRLAVKFLVDARLPHRAVRFDVVGVRLDHEPATIEHVRAAF